MIRYDLFRAISPDESYPNTPFNLSLHEVKYDMPLPIVVSDAFMQQLTCNTKFNRIDKLCTPTGMKSIRCNPTSLNNIPHSYAGCEIYHDIEEPNATMGFIKQTAIISKSIVESYLRFVIDTNNFDEDVVLWMYKHFKFLTSCGGVEITRMFFYTDPDEREQVLSIIDAPPVTHLPESIIESTGRKTSFRDMVNS